MSKIIDHLKQPSTIKGFLVLGGLLGIRLNPEQIESIIYLVGSILAVYEIVRNEHGTDKK
jgi:hypothetical protein